MLLTFSIGTWQPVIGDASIEGWLTVYLYGICALLSFINILDGKSEKKTKSFFILYGSIFVVLTLIKRFDLLSGVTALIRVFLQSIDLISVKRITQVCVMGVIGVLFLYIVLKCKDALFVQSDRVLYNLTALSIVLGTFVLFRSISLHQFETILGLKIFGRFRINSIFEITLLIIIMIHLVFVIVTSLKKRGN